MRGLLRDPLVHFLLVGAAVFGILSVGGEPEPRTIVVGEDDVLGLVEQAALAGGAPPSPGAIEPLIESFLREEVLYREALALGLDENDDEVRRRLVEKMAYLIEDLADPEPASDSELLAFYESRRERFAVPALATFEQIYFNVDQRADTLEEDVQQALSALAEGGDAGGLGDRTPLRASYEAVPREQVAVLFGDAIAETLFTVDPGDWRGPLESDFGMHLVRLVSRAPAYQPAFDAVREDVLAAFAEERRLARNEAAYREIRERYEIVVEWPEGLPGPEPPQ